MIEALDLFGARRAAMAERAERVRAAGPATRAASEEIGVTGTTLFGGFLRDQGEYHSDLMGTAAFRTYEEMRRSDAQVYATLAAIKLPIRGAQWAVVPPDDATPIEREAAEFLEDELFERIDWDATLENALLMLDFGCAAHEDVYEIDGGQVHLKKLAPRLAITFDQWLTKPGTDELEAIKQIGYRCGQYVYVDLPLDKATLFTFQKEGANYAGRALLRAMYKPWYMKKSLEIVDAIANERNGMGVPYIEMGGQVRAEDRRAAQDWMEKLSVHENAAITLPPEWKFGLAGVTGTVKSAKDSIAYHNTQISAAGLNTFLQLGTSETGSRAVGQTLSDFFGLSLQALAKTVARAINLTTVRRLCTFNFGEMERYPQLVAQQVLAVKLETVSDALAKLAAGTVDAVQPDDELEAWLRKQMGLPEKAKPRMRPATPAAGAAPGGEPEPPKKGGQDARVPGARDAGDEEEDDEAPKQEMSEGGALKLSRDPRGVEKFLALGEIVGALDKTRDAVAAALRDARDRVQAEILVRLVNMPARQMHRASVEIDERLVAAVEASLRELAEFGAGQVAEERDRQRKGMMPGDAASMRREMFAAGKKKRTIDSDPVGLFADGAVSEFTNVLQQRAITTVLDLMRRGLTNKGEIVRDADEALDGQSDKWIDAISAKAANESFAEGRAEGYEQFADEIEEVEYSALLDGATCQACAAADGATGKTPEDIQSVPNPDCDGGDRCRCVHVFKFAAEGKVA